MPRRKSKRVVTKVVTFRKVNPRRVLHGGSIWGDIWDGVKSVGSTILPILKSTGAASTLAGVSGNPGLAAGLKLAGYGRGKRHSVINA